MRQVNADWPTVSGVKAGELKPKLLGACALRLRASCISCKLTTSSPPPPSPQVPLVIASLRTLPLQAFKDVYFVRRFSLSICRNVTLTNGSSSSSASTPFDSLFDRYLPYPLRLLCGAFNNEKWLPHVFDFYFVLISFHFTWLDSTQLCQVPSGGRHITGLPFIAFYFFSVSIFVFFFCLIRIRTRVVLAQHFRSPADHDWYRHFSPLSSGYTETGASVIISREGH